MEPFAQHEQQTLNQTTNLFALLVLLVSIEISLFSLRIVGRTDEAVWCVELVCFIHFGTVRRMHV